jgi:hypothetical protein
MFPCNITLRCAITEETDIDGEQGLTLYGYEVGAVYDKQWQALIVSPIIYGSMKDAQAVGDAALSQAHRALVKRKMKNAILSAKLSRWRGEDDAS